MRNACKSTAHDFLVKLFPNTNSKNRCQQTAGTCMMHLWVISIIAPRDWSQFPSVRPQTKGSQPLWHFYHARLVFSAVRTCSRVKISKWQVSGAADLSCKVLQPIQRLNATRNSIHMHYVHFTCSLVEWSLVYSTFVCGAHSHGGSLIHNV